MLRKLVRTDAGLSRSRLDVLAADGFGYVLRRHVVGSQSVRVQPHAHRIVAASHDFHQTHTVDAFQLAENVDVGKVIDKLFGMRTVGAEYVQIHQHTVHFLFSDHSGTDHFFRELVEHGGHAVLHVHGCHVGVGPYLEIDSGQRHAVVRTYCGHIRHSRHTVDGPLQRSGYRFRHDIGTCARIAGSDGDRRRHDVRKLRDGQTCQRHDAQADNQHGNHAG